MNTVIVLVSIGIVFLTILAVVSFGRYMYQRGFTDGLEEAGKIMIEVRGMKSNETNSKRRSERDI